MAERQCVSITITCVVSVLLGVEPNTVYGITSHLEKIVRSDIVVPSSLILDPPFEHQY